MANRLKQRKKERQAERYGRISGRLHERVEKLEEKVFSEEEVDLFLSVMQSALADDQEKKEPFYVAVLDWMIKEKPPAVHVRILAGAVQNLSYLELYCFLHAHHGGGIRPHQTDLDDVVLCNRLAGAGLSDGAMARMKANATNLGERLAKYCGLDALAKPNGWRDIR